MLIVWNSEPWDLECWKLGFAIQALHHSISKRNTKRGLKSWELTVTSQYLCKILVQHVFESCMRFFNSSPIHENNVYCWRVPVDPSQPFYHNWGDNVSVRKTIREVEGEPIFYRWPDQRPLDEIEPDCLMISLHRSVFSFVDSIPDTHPRTNWYSASSSARLPQGAHV